jgi:hypothetical protein
VRTPPDLSSLAVDEIEAHEAILAWKATAAPGFTVVAIECLKHAKKTSAFRLRTSSAPGSVIAKRSRPRDTWESRIYTQVLPAAGLPTAEIYGQVDDPDGLSSWLVMEDLGDQFLLPTNADDRRLVAEWLARLHTAESVRSLQARLPNRGPSHSLKQLQSVREGVEHLIAEAGEKGLPAETLTAVAHHLATLSRLWPRFSAICGDAPEALIHGDFQRKNARVRETNGGRELLVLDWEPEMCGWGVPCIDLAQHALGSLTPDLSTYWSGVVQHWPSVTQPLVDRLARIGRVCRLVVALEWTVRGSSAVWAAQTLQPYLPALDAGLRTVENL